MTRDFREILFDLVQELSTELDLHYEDDEFFALRATIGKLQEAALALTEAGLEPPASYAHVVARFESRKVGKTYVTEAQVQPTRYVEAKTRIGGMEVKETANDLVELIAEWINDSEAMAEDLASPEANVVADEPEDDEDEDFAVEDDEQ